MYVANKRWEQQVRKGKGERQGGEKRKGGLTRDGDVGATRRSSKRVSDGSECSSHGI